MEDIVTSAHGDTFTYSLQRVILCRVPQPQASPGAYTVRRDSKAPRDPTCPREGHSRCVCVRTDGLRTQISFRADPNRF